MIRFAAAVLPIALLVACSDKNAVAEKVEDNADRRAEAMERASQSMTNALQRNAMEQQADTLRSAGKERAEAIRDSQLKSGILDKDQQNALVAGKTVPGTSSKSGR